MNNTYIADWQATKRRFEQWWKREKTDKPLMRIIAEGRQGAVVPVKQPSEPRDLYLDTSLVLNRFRNYFETHYFLADAYPSVNLDIGPGSMVLYLGGEPEFSWETVWFKEFMNSCEEFEDICYDEHNKWWTLHKDMMREAMTLSNGDFYINIPDIIENLDILSAMRGPQELCYDITEYPDIVRAGVEKIDGLYFKYYDGFYDIVKDVDGSSSFTGFNVLGTGKTAKLQCDFSAMISPDMFRKYVQPSIRKQCQKLEHSIYHLDGPDAIKHLDALMEIDELDAIQWQFTCGPGQLDGGSEKWYPIYDRVREAGKGLSITILNGTPGDWAESAKRIVNRYGMEGIYFLFPEFPDLESAYKMAKTCF